MSTEMKSGIYAFRCLANGKFYIGQAKDLVVRYNEHIYKLTKRKHRNKHFESAWYLHGPDNFVYGIIEHCAIENLTTREQYWLDLYKSWDKKYGYNIAKDAGAFHRGIRHSAETRRKMSLAHTGMTSSKETKMKLRAASKARMSTPEAREESRQRAKQMWADPAKKAQILKAKELTYERRRKEQLETLLIEEISKRIASSVQTILNPKFWCAKFFE